MAPRPTPSGTGTEAAASRATWAKQTRHALATLSREQRLVLELAYFKSMSQAEIARRLGLPLPIVQITAATGLVRLGQVLQAENV